MSSSLENRTIARRYARAYFALALEASAVDAITTDLAALETLLALGGDFNALLHDATLARADQEKAIAAIAAHLKLSSLTAQALGTLAQKRRLPVLPEFVAEAQVMIAVQKGIVTAEVISATPLDDKQLKDLTDSLRKATGKDVKLHLSVDPEIMGGLIVRIGSRQMDSSVRTKLDRMHRALKSSNAKNDQKKMKEVA